MITVDRPSSKISDQKNHLKSINKMLSTKVTFRLARNSHSYLQSTQAARIRTVTAQNTTKKLKTRVELVIIQNATTSSLTTSIRSFAGIKRVSNQRSIASTWFEKLLLTSVCEWKAALSPMNRRLRCSACRRRSWRGARNFNAYSVIQLSSRSSLTPSFRARMANELT